MVFSVHNSFQAKNYRVFRAGLFAGLGLTGIVPVIHGWIVNYNIAAVHKALGLDILMGVIYLVRRPTPAFVSSSSFHTAAKIGINCCLSSSTPSHPFAAEWLCWSILYKMIILESRKHQLICQMCNTTAKSTQRKCQSNSSCCLCSGRKVLQVAYTAPLYCMKHRCKIKLYSMHSLASQASGV